MRGIRSVSIICLSACLPVAINGAEPRASLPLDATPGTHFLAIKSGGIDRFANVHVPTGFKSGTQLPLVVVLHGLRDGTFALDNNGWAAKSDKEGFIALAPEGFAPPGQDPNARTQFWNYDQSNTGVHHGDDVTFIGDVLHLLKTTLPYDESRIFCVGEGKGGSMAFRLVDTLSERIAALGVVSGKMTLQNPRPTKPIPTLFIVGTSNPQMPIDGGVLTFPVVVKTRTEPPINEFLTRWAKGLGCDVHPNRCADMEMKGAECYEYPSSAKGPTLKVIYIKGHGAQWPGGRAGAEAAFEDVFGPVASTVNATDVLWDFFKQYNTRSFE